MRFLLAFFHNKKRIRALLGQVFPKRQAWWRWLLGVGLTAIIVSSCGGTAINHNEVLTAKPSSTPCRVVQHAMGETCVPNNPQKVITLVHHALGHMLVLDVKPIGSNVRSIEQLTGDYLDIHTYLGNKTEGIKAVGLGESQGSLEKISLMKPDLILATEYVGDTYPLLSQIAPVAIVPYNDVVLNWKEGFNSIAELLGKKEKAQQVLNHYYQRIEELKVALGDRYQGQVISVVGGDVSAMTTFVKNSFPGSILEDLELQRPTSQNAVARNGAIYNISEERIEQIDGDVLFFLASQKADIAAFERLRQRPLWKKLKAVQKNQVYLVDHYTWTGSNLLAADAVIDDLYKYLLNTP
ncbi:MAG: ABC transporter substrate-binding protein [Nodosilinea sp.]